MTTYGDIPGAKMQTGDIATTGPSTHEFHHIDDFDRTAADPSSVVHLYAFESENRADELTNVCADCRQSFIFASGIVFPDSLKPVVEDRSDEYLEALEWALVLCPKTGDLPADELIAIADHIDNESLI